MPLIFALSRGHRPANSEVSYQLKKFENRSAMRVADGHRIHIVIAKKSTTECEIFFTISREGAMGPAGPVP